MVTQLLWITIIYASAVALVHILLKRRETSSGRNRHVVLITRNHEEVVEWYIRALSLHAIRTGMPLQVTVLDDQSEDQTVDVACRLVRESALIDVQPLVEADVLQTMGDDVRIQPVMLDLRRMGSSGPLPFMNIPGE